LVCCRKNSPTENRGFWSVNIANPTDQPINVTKIVIIGTSPVTGASDSVIRENCEEIGDEPYRPRTVSPTTDQWYCPGSNQLVWENTFSPQSIGPRDIFSFKVRITGDTIGVAGNDPTNIIVQPLVFSSLGQFAGSVYGTTFTKEATAIPNVSLTVNPNSFTDSDIMTFVPDVISGSVVTFTATLADLVPDATYYINDDARVIVNIPRDWIIDPATTIVSRVGFQLPIIQLFADGSSQISAQLLPGNIIEGTIDAESIVFTATAPSGTDTKLYIMHILADGTVHADDPDAGVYDIAMGPIGETVLQVCGTAPTTPCP